MVLFLNTDQLRASRTDSATETLSAADMREHAITLLDEMTHHADDIKQKK